MSLRFRRSVKLAPGLRLNFSGSGMSLTAGPRGASFNFGRRGTYFNGGIPGTGLYSRTRLDSPPAAAASGSRYTAVKLRITCEDDGTVNYEYDGKPAPDFMVAKAKRQYGPAIRQMLQECCDKANAVRKALVEIHRETPAPTQRVKFARQAFDEPKPRPPVPKPHGFLGWLFQRVARRIDAENAAAREKYDADVAAWESQRREFDAREDEREDFLERRIFTDPEAMEKHLDQALHDIEWPRETHVSFEIGDGGKSLLADVDLPEIEDMPATAWSLPARGYRPTLRKLTEPEACSMYSAHVQGIGFRIVGEAFALLPSVDTVTVSAYTQRTDRATGTTRDDYLYSVRVTRESWSAIDFTNLAAVDVGEALARFELRREQRRDWRLEPIEPFHAAAALARPEA